jgi:hypothetical protein
MFSFYYQVLSLSFLFQACPRGLNQLLVQGLTLTASNNTRTHCNNHLTILFEDLIGFSYLCYSIKYF